MKRFAPLMMLVLLICSACGAPSDTAPKTQADTTTPQGSVQAALDALIQGDYETMAQYTSDSEKKKHAGAQAAHGENQQLLEELFKNMEYTVDNVAIQGEEATAVLTVTNTDHSKVLARVMEKELDQFLEHGDTMDGEEAQVMMLEALEEADSGQTNTQSVEVKMKKAEDRWKLQISPPLMDAISGGFLANSSEDTEVLAQLAQADLQNTLEDGLYEAIKK